MATPQLVCVDPVKVPEIWPHVVALLEKAVFSGRGDDTIEEIRADLDAQRQLLWIGWDGEAIIVAATTKIVESGMGKRCIITTCGGRKLRAWQHFIADMEAFATREKCTTLRIHGRHGWKRILTGYQEPWVAIEKRLKG